MTATDRIPAPLAALDGTVATICVSPPVTTDAVYQKADRAAALVAPNPLPFIWTGVLTGPLEGESPVICGLSKEGKFEIRVAGHAIDHFGNTPGQSIPWYGSYDLCIIPEDNRRAAKPLLPGKKRILPPRGF